MHPTAPLGGRVRVETVADEKGFTALPRDYQEWGVPYLPIDPKHVGRTYEAVVRVNSQSEPPSVLRSVAL